MLTRRLTITLLAAAAFGAMAADTGLPATPEKDRAIALVERTGAQLIAIASSTDSAADKRRRLAEIVASDLDVDDIGRFCLGPFWSSATPEQQSLYLTQFRELLIGKIAAYLPNYQDVTLTTGSVASSKDRQVVATVVARRDHSVTVLDWVVSATSGNPRIIDILAGGTSMRQTQRADVVAFLLRHDNSIDQLNAGMGRLVAWDQF